MKHFLICTIGRTGSTLLVHILNTQKNVSVCGELFGDIFFKKLSENKKINNKDIRIFTNYKFITDRKTSPFYTPHNIVFKKIKNNDLGELLVENKNVINNLFPQDKISGAKCLIKTETVESMINSKHINIKLILLIRNPDDTIRSMKKSGFGGKKYTLDSIKKYNKKMIEISEKYPNETFLINYDDIININSKLKKLFNFLNIEGFNNSIIECCLQTRCSYGNVHKS